MKSIIAFLLSVLNLIIGAYAINPVREYKATPENFGLPYKEQKIKTADGYLLNTWLVEPKEDSGKNYTFVIAYGDAGNMSYQLPYIAALVARGYTVVTFDYRGFGQSSDFEINKEQQYYNEFTTDLITALHWAKQQNSNDKIIVWAFSMGTIMATQAFKKEPFDILVGEGFVVAPPQVVERIKVQKGKTLVLPKGATQVENNIKKINIPMLLVCAKYDTITTLDDCHKITRGFRNRKVLEFEGKHLEGAFVIGLQNYIEKIEKMMK